MMMSSTAYVESLDVNVCSGAAFRLHIVIYFLPPLFVLLESLREDRHNQYCPSSVSQISLAL